MICNNVAGLRMIKSKIVGISVYIFIITCIFYSCMNLKTHKPIKHNNSLKVVKDYSVGAQNFVYLFKTVEPKIDCPTTECAGVISSTASGLVFSSYKNTVFILTADHFCQSDEKTSMMFKEEIIGVAGDKYRELYVLKQDKENDLCMLFGIKEKNESFKNIKIANNFVVGEDVYTVAAPNSIGGPGIRMVFTGKLSGCNDTECITTMAASFGSSGAGIYNSKHELITIIMAIPSGFNHVIFSPSTNDIKIFIRNIDDLIDIYSY